MLGLLLRRRHMLLEMRHMSLEMLRKPAPLLSYMREFSNALAREWPLTGRLLSMPRLHYLLLALYRHEARRVEIMMLLYCVLS